MKKKKVTQKTNTELCNCAKNDTYVAESDRLRRFSLQLYAEPCHWGKLLQNAQHYAYILHDKDVNPDGTPKTPHYHLLVMFADAKTKSSVRKMTDIDSLTEDTTINFQKLINPRNAFRYLIHDTPEAKSDGKYQYSLDAVKYDSADFWCDCDASDSNAEFLDDLLSDSMNERSMALKYGRDYIRNRTCYRAFADTLRCEDIKHNVAKNRDELLNSLADADNALENVDDTIDDVIVQYIGALLAKRYIDNIDYETSTPECLVSYYVSRLQNKVLSVVKENLRK